jgi:pyruvate/2-oxoglutarate dehydrogenase complex dihydrolipoamide acyltransferase (E2) component
VRVEFSNPNWRAAASRCPAWECMGVKEFSAILNPPHFRIVAVGAAAKRAVVTDDALTVDSGQSLLKHA